MQNTTCHFCSDKLKPSPSPEARCEHHWSAYFDYGATKKKSCTKCGYLSNELWESSNSPEARVDGETSDGYHTFNELYEHRVLLWINLCLTAPIQCYVVEEHYAGLFLLGMATANGQISYHCPNKYLDLVKNIKREQPEFDGHTSKQVIERLLAKATQEKSCEARVDWKKVDEKIDSAVEFYFEDCSCEQGHCCNSCNLKMELSKIFKAAFEKGREAR